MAVIYEQQRWDGEIIDERDAKQAIPHTMETVVGGCRPTHRARVGANLEGEEDVKIWALNFKQHLTNYLTPSFLV